MIFKKNAESEIFWLMLSFLLLLGIFISVVWYFSVDKSITQVIANSWKVFLFIFIICIAKVLKIKYDKNIIYIIQNNKIVIKEFNQTKEINIDNVEKIINSNSVYDGEIKYRYLLVIRGSNEYPTRIRHDMYNEDGETLFEHLEDKYNIKTIVNSTLW